MPERYKAACNSSTSLPVSRPTSTLVSMARNILAGDYTPFAVRVRAALSHAQMNMTQAALALTESRGTPVKNQTIQWMASKAEKSHLTVDLAKLCGVSLTWLRDGTGPMVAASIDDQIDPVAAKEGPVIPYGLPPHLRNLLAAALAADAVLPKSFFEGITKAIESLAAMNSSA